MTQEKRIEMCKYLLQKTIAPKDKELLSEYLSMRNEDGSIQSYAGKDALIEKILKKYERNEP